MYLCVPLYQCSIPANFFWDMSVRFLSWECWDFRRRHNHFQILPKNSEGGVRKGLRWWGFALFLVRFCGNSYFNSRYCGFKTLSSLRLLQPLGLSFQWKKSTCGNDTLSNGWLSVVLQERAKCFVLQRIKVYYISLQFNSVVCNTAFSS